MSRTCREFERFLESPAAAARNSRFEQHVGQCPLCRGQEAADRELTELFMRTAPARLSKDFRPALRLRLVAEAPAPVRRRAVVMKTYWLVAAAISTLILLSPDWRGLSDATVWRAGLLVAVVCVALPAHLLAHRLNFGLVALIARTMSVPGGRPD